MKPIKRIKRSSKVKWPFTIFISRMNQKPLHGLVLMCMEAEVSSKLDYILLIDEYGKRKSQIAVTFPERFALPVFFFSQP